MSISDINSKIAQKRANILATLKKSGLDSSQGQIDPISLSLQQLSMTLQNSVDPHLTESHKLSQIVNKSISSLQMRKKRAEDTMNTLTEIIELRSSCQMVWNNLDDIFIDDGLDFSKLDNAVYFMSKVISLVEILDEG
jgi:hypothetical protein